MFRIKTLNTISAKGLNEFPRELYEVGSDIAHPDALLVRSFNLYEYSIPPSVKVIGRAGAGVNTIPVTKLTESGIPVLNTPGANANAVRELVIAGMLLASRSICNAWEYVKTLEMNDEELEKNIEQNKKKFVGRELFGKTIGVIGLGSIGVKVANAALHLGMKVIGFDPTITVNRAWELSSEVKQAQSLDDLLIEADYITIHVPLTPETKHMINTQRLQLMKDEVVLLNFSRKGIINEDELLESLSKKNSLIYVTDFPSKLLMQHPRVICLPHLGASTHEAEENCAVMIAKQIRDFFESGSISNSVNFPAIEMPKLPSGVRVAITNKNVPNMVAQFSSILANGNANILSLLNKSREDIAYTLIDINKDINSEIMQEIAKINGVIQVRKVETLR